jgi:hypothetical protein
MPTPNKPPHTVPEGQQLINAFLKQTPRSSSMMTIIKNFCDDSDEQPIAAEPLKRRRIIRDDDDDQGCTAHRACTALPDNGKADIINVSDDDNTTANHSPDHARTPAQRASDVGKAKKPRSRTNRKKRPTPKPVR